MNTLIEYLTPSKKTISFEGEKKRVKTSLVKILEKEKIGAGKYGIIDKTRIKIGGKYRDMAMKTFYNKKYVDNSMEIHHKLKAIGIPTWITYRKCDDNKILMTLGNKDDSVLFSANNESKDTGVLKANKIKDIVNLEGFYRDSYSTLKKLTDNNLGTYFDAYMLLVKDQKISLVVGDFDWIKDGVCCEEDGTIKEYNMEQMLCAFLMMSSYFDIGKDFFFKFIKYIKKQKEVGDEFLSNVNIDIVCDNAYNRVNMGKY